MITYSNDLSLTYFTKHNILWFHPCCCKWQHFILMAESYSIECVCVCNVLVYSSVDGHVGCFHILATINTAVVDIRCMCLSELLFLFSSDLSYGNSIFSFVKNLHTFSTVVSPIYVPTNSVQGFLFFPHPWQYLLCVFLLMTAILAGLN